MADARTRVMNLSDPFAMNQLFPSNLPPKEVDLTPDSDITIKGGTLSIPQEDGSILIDLRPDLTKRAEEAEHTENLADLIDPTELSRIASNLLEGIDSDESSRKDWLETRARGLNLLGLKLEEGRSDVASSAPLEGMSTVRHPLLLEAVLRFQAMARGELLPASGPVKVRNDTPPNPDMPAPALGQDMQYVEDVATSLERDLNHYLTVSAPEYYPDTDRMLFTIGFGGLGIKKVYNCPLRRRPVSESIDPKDFIVSNAATDLSNAGRLTHRIMMRPSTLKRMQIVGAYRDVAISPATVDTSKNEVDKTIGEIQGISVKQHLFQPEDQEQELYESYCELDIAGYEHKDEDDKVTGLRVPYKVTVHKESRQVLEVRRNYEEDDPLCMPSEVFVDFQFVPGLGFYPIGLLHILGNSTMALTAAWREMLDACMFGNFPGFIYNKSVGRQLTNEFRVAPGGGVGIEVGMQRIQDAIMPLPYKEPGGAMINFIQRVEELAQRIGGTAEANVGEGKQDAPVGTTLALIEQATKMIDAVHKRLHASQQREFALLKKRFKEDPESFWRHRKKPRVQWQTDMFLAALDANEIVPVADPNNPTSLHRVAKASFVAEAALQAPSLFDQMAVAKRVFRIMGIDSEGLFLQQQAPAPADPRMEAVKVKGMGMMQQAQAQEKMAMVKAGQVLAQSKDKAADRTSKERLEIIKLQGQQKQLDQNLQLEQRKAQFEEEGQRRELQFNERKGQMDMQMEAQKNIQKLQIERAKNASKAMAERQKMVMKNAADAQKMQGEREMMGHEMNMERERSTHQMQTEKELNQSKMTAEKEINQSKAEAAKEGMSQKLRQGEESHKVKLQQKKEMAAVKPAAKPKAKKD